VSTATEPTVYLDRDQCDRFTVGDVDAYFDEAKVVIAASTLLNSKDYDDAHRDVLAPLGHKTVVLVRAEMDAPGWFRIDSVL
jgi:hypothetical protein